MRLAIAASLLVITTFAADGRADTCPPLEIVASVPMRYDQAGRPYVPVTVGTTHSMMLVDTGGALSVISPQLVDILGLPGHRVLVRQYSVTGQYTDRAADASPFLIGNLIAQHMEFMVDPDSAKFASGTWAGIIGPNILRNYDAEFDFGGNRFNLVSQDHCPGKVIYWPADRTASLQVEIDAHSGHILVPVTLDGVSLRALIDTGASQSFLNADVAERDYGLEPPPRSSGSPPGGALPARGNRFQTLSLQGIIVTNPLIAIVPDMTRGAFPDRPPAGSRLAGGEEKPGMKDITLGADVLRHLHFYIAYKEQVLYATPAAPSERHLPASQPRAAVEPSRADK